MSMRDEQPYLKRLKRFRNALAGIGLENDDTDALVGKIKLNGVEELMLASYSMMSYIRDYLDMLKTPYEKQLKIVDIYVSLHLAILCITKKGSYQLMSEEAAKMEMVSRSCYAWLKAHRMLKAPLYTSTELR